MPQLAYGDDVQNAFQQISVILNKRRSREKNSQQPLSQMHREQRVKADFPPSATLPPIKKTLGDQNDTVGARQRVESPSRQPSILPPVTNSKQTPIPSLPPMPTQWKMNHIFDEAGKKMGIDDLLKSKSATTWWSGWCMCVLVCMYIDVKKNIRSMPILFSNCL